MKRIVLSERDHLVVISELICAKALTSSKGLIERLEAIIDQLLVAEDFVPEELDSKVRGTRDHRLPEN